MESNIDQTAVESSRRTRFILVSAVVALSLLGDALLYALLPARPEEFGVLVPTRMIPDSPRLLTWLRCIRFIVQIKDCAFAILCF